MNRRMGLWWVVIFGLMLVAPMVSAQQSINSCGVVDVLDYPIGGLVPGYDDFNLYRERFGGNHTGLDIGFDRWGDPVYAAARGLVTYADPEGWGTEKGVVIVQITFPDGSVFYTLYGHMEESDTIKFPQVGTCVERGAVIGTIGWPSQGRPHLHYEIRNFLPDDGGPGYVTDNPIDHGWFDPLDFTAVWRVRLTPTFISAMSFDLPPSLPPITLDSGLLVTASDDVVSALLASGQEVWRIKADSTVTGIAGLSGDRVVVHTQSGQVSVLQGGRYQAVWQVSGASQPFVALGEKLIFPMDAGGLAAYDTAGNVLWQQAGSTGESVLYFGVNGNQIGVALRGTSGIHWQTVDENGQVSAAISLDAPPTIYPLSDGSWLALENNRLLRLKDGDQEVIATLASSAGSAAEITTDAADNIYLYLDDAQNTLLSLDKTGQVRWQKIYNGERDDDWPPLLQAGKSCLLYSLDANGLLHVFSSNDGSSLNQIQLYAGGRRTTQPGARLLRVSDSEQVQVAAGFLSMLTLDGMKLGGSTIPQCPQ